MLKLPIAVFVSGGGTNLGALIEAERNGVIQSGEIVLVVSDNPTAYALERAKAAGIHTFSANKKEIGGAEFERLTAQELDRVGAKLIILAGFLSILSADFTAKYAGRIINIHPSLIPSFCGKGCYGLHVHEKALSYGVKVTGATVHYVNEIPDGGRIIMQKAVEVKDGDTPQILQKRVMEEAEWVILPQSAEIVSKKLLSEENL